MHCNFHPDVLLSRIGRAEYEYLLPGRHFVLAVFFQRLYEVAKRGKRKLRIARRLCVVIIHRVIERVRNIVFIIAIEEFSREGTYQNDPAYIELQCDSRMH
jgi:hypothetical protein